MNTHKLISDRLHQKAGLYESSPSKFSGVSFKQLWDSEWDRDFERLMRNRLVMGAMRYEPMARKKQTRGKWNLRAAMRSKLENYERTGNREYLVDLANYCLIAFSCDDHPGGHFRALDDHHDHCKKK